MSKQSCLSVIVPFFNASFHINKCLNALRNQNFSESFEIIMVDDASTDNTLSIIKKYNLPNLRLYSLSANSGPAAARNFGIKKAEGEYIFFLDVDDTIADNTLSTLYNLIKENQSDLAMCDKKWIENLQNQRSNIFFYPEDQFLEVNRIKKEMRNRLFNPSLTSNGLFDLTGKLIKRSIIIKNNIFLEEKLRYFEDEVFMWDIIAFINSVSYVRKQLYSHYVHPNINTAVSNALETGLLLSHFKLIKIHIQNSLKQKGFSVQEIEKLGDQAFIFSIISSLVSFSRSMILGKMKLRNAIKYRREIIQNILADFEVSKAIKNYKISQNENPWIPRAIGWRSHWLLEFACNRRAKEVVRKRRMSKN